MINFVSTPIGNLSDISLRALETLKKSDIIYCEDTRTSKTLLDYYDIKSKTLLSYHKFNEKETTEKIIFEAKKGKEISIISDAGTPAISDPGEILIAKLIENNVDYTIIPGACALICGLVLSGFNTKNFYFAGFLPEKLSMKKHLLSEIVTLKSTIIFYVSPHNLKKDIQFLYENLGDRKACLIKEITKLHETKIFFNLSTLPAIDERGEFVLIIEGANDNNFSEKTILEHVKFYINLGFTKNDAIKKVAKERGVNKNSIYLEVLNL